MKTPFFSILIPAYNNLETLRKAVISVLDQDFPDYEIIISDDCSPTDIVSGIEREFPNNGEKIRLFRQQSNLGVLGNQIFVLSQAKGKYCVFLQHDDFFLSNELLGEIHRLIISENPVLVVGNALLENPSLTYELIFGHEVFPEEFFNLSHSGYRTIQGLDLASVLCPIVGEKYLVLSWSSVFFNRKVLHLKLGFTAYYLTSKKMELALNTYVSEENMTAFWMMLEEGKICITIKPISFRGRPPTAFSNSLQNPGRKVANNIEFFNLIRASKLVNSNQLKKILINRAISIGISQINVETIRYLRDVEVSLLIFARISIWKTIYRTKKLIKRIIKSSYWKKGPRAIVSRVLHGPRP